uniref:Uncharacterized protein n=1 Tax=Salarias fasciatus TaxID=181472 RepID=A0A672FHX9_SALFA
MASREGFVCGGEEKKALAKSLGDTFPPPKTDAYGRPPSSCSRSSIMSDSFIIAIHFGRSYSGYAFSLTAREAEIDPMVKYWGAEVGQKTVKTPTCILFDEHEEFMSFGYEAQRYYHRMRGEEARHKFFFQSFKMSLYGRKLHDGVTIPAASGKPMKALKVFTEALRFMKDDALKTINSSSGKVFNQSDFCWVLTVPAIWDPSAKQFMRRAATQAGIVTEGKEDWLVIALEPEAALMWCRKLVSSDLTSAVNPVIKRAVLSCCLISPLCSAGGTIDVTVHEVLDGGALRELHKGSGNNMGGQSVDRKFKEFLKEIFGDALWEKRRLWLHRISRAGLYEEVLRKTPEILDPTAQPALVELVSCLEEQLHAVTVKWSKRFTVKTILENNLE